MYEDLIDSRCSRMVDGILYRMNLPYRLRPDAHQAGMLGAFLAAPKYDPHKGTSFLAFAQPSATWSILEHLRQQDHLTKYHRRQIEAGTAFPVYYCELPEAWLLPSAGANPEQIALRQNVMETARNVLTKQEWAIVYGMYWDGLNSKDLSYSMNISHQWVSQLHVRALSKLAKFFR